MDDYQGFSPEEFLGPLRVILWTRADIEAHHKPEEFWKVPWKRLIKPVTEPTKEY